MLSSEDEDDMISYDEEDEDDAWNLLLDIVGQSYSGMLVVSFLEDEEFARTALSCHLVMDILCQEMQAAWQSEDCRREMMCWSDSVFSSAFFLFD